MMPPHGACVTEASVRGPGASPAPLLCVSNVGGAEPPEAVGRPLSLPWRVLQRKVVVSALRVWRTLLKLWM